MSEPEAIKFCPIEYQRGYNSGYNEGKLVGGLIAAGGILGLIAVVSFAFCCYKKKCSKLLLVLITMRYIVSSQ